MSSQKKSKRVRSSRPDKGERRPKLSQRNPKRYCKYFWEEDDEDNQDIEITEKDEIKSEE